MTVSKSKQEIIANEKAAATTHRKANPQLPTVKTVDQELADAKRKIAQLEKRLANSSSGPEFIIESPVLHDQAAWAQLNNGKNAKALRSFMLPHYLQVHSQPMIEDATGRNKKIKGGTVELIRGKGAFDNPDWAKYLSLNFPDYVISQRTENGTYKRYVAQVVIDPREEFEQEEEFYYDELPQTARTLAAANPQAQVINPYMPVVTVAPTPTRQQAKMPQELRDMLAARAEESGAPEAVLVGS